MLVGYARVSTLDQETHLQRDALGRAGVTVVYEDKASGVASRPQLRRALASMAPGDVLVVWKLDRVARSLSDLLSILRALSDAGCAFRSLTEPVDTSTPIGEFILQVLGAVAQLERSMIRQRTIAGQVAFLQRGGVFGRPKILTVEQEEDCLRRMQAGEALSAIARSYGVSRMVMTRIQAESRGLRDTGRLPVLRQYL